MKRSISIVIIVIASISSLHAMDIINSYVSLTDNTLHDIHEQQYALCERINSVETGDGSIFSLSLRDLCNLSDDNKYAIINHMHLLTSKTVSLLLGSAMILPKELIENHICLCMFDGHKVAAEHFYKEPLLHAFDVYYQVRAGLADDNKPIGPLYLASQAERDAVLRVKKLWYYSVPIMSSEEKKLLDAVSDPLKQVYLQDQEVVIVPYDACTSKQLLKIIFLSSGVTLLSFGGMAGGLALIGSFFGITLGMSCHPVALATEATCAGICGSCTCLGMLMKGVCDISYHSMRVII